MPNRFLLILILISQASISLAQDIPIGDWRDHLPYSDAISVSYGNNIAYCATNSAVFMYDITDNSIERLNLVNGLSDIGLSKIKFNNYNDRVIIAYKNGNIDIIDENKNITNLSFIKNSSIIGNKTINHIYIQGKLAYLSTGFGIVVLDTDKKEIVDTYLFGPLGSFVATNAVTMDNNNIYAATDQGVFYANKNSTNLIDYNVWSLLPDLGANRYSNIVTFSNRIFTTLESTTWDGDTIFYNDSGVWQKFISTGVNVNNINVANNYLFISLIDNVKKYDLQLSLMTTVYSYKSLFTIRPFETIMDDEGYILMADETHGMLRIKNSWTGEMIIPNGPASANVFKMDFINDELWLSSGAYDPQTYAPSNIKENLINYKKDGFWSSIAENINNISGNKTSDAVSIAINPRNNSQIFFGTWDNGLFEINNGNVTNIYTAQNSVLDSTFFGSTKIGALAYDDENNLWISNSFTNHQLAVKTPDNNWYSFSFGGSINANNVFTKMLIDRNNYKWIVEPKLNSVIVFDDNGTPNLEIDDRVILNNNIPGTKLHSIVEDLDGEIWVGTDEGIAVFYNPSLVFDENIEAEQIYIQQDGQTQILLETETVTVIEIDGANRKWIGTQNSGVFLMSEDGTEQMEHFTTDNSPLFSNNIFDIVIDPKTGEVYFGTEKGLLSYKGTATDADDDFNNVFVYPNPVKPDFTGTIAIRGLVKDTDVRITDISGNIVYQTTSLGGQAIWDGKDFNGNKVQTGVYMIFNGGPEGERKAAAKILFIH